MIEHSPSDKAHYELILDVTYNSCLSIFKTGFLCSQLQHSTPTYMQIKGGIETFFFVFGQNAINIVEKRLVQD